MPRLFTKLFVFFIITFLLFCKTKPAYATATVTAASGGSSISADTTGGTYTLLTNPKIIEEAVADVGTGTIILVPPSGFVFDTGTNVTLTVTSGSCSGGGNAPVKLGTGSGAANETVTPAADSITNNVKAISKGAAGCASTLTYTNIKVRPSAGTPLASGNITKSASSSSTIKGVTNGSTNFGTLTEVVGAKNKLGITTQPSTSAILATDFGTKPVVKLQDQFGNTVTGDSASTIATAVVISTAACGGTAGSGTLSSTPASGSAVTAGVMTYTAMQYSTSQSIKICFTSSGVTSALSNAITVVPGAPTSVSATDGTYTDKVTVTWTKSTGATGYRVYRDASDVSGLLGDVATYDDTGAAVPTITAGTASASDGTSTTQVALSIAGESANNGTTHTYKVVAVGSGGNSADSSTNTGYRGVGTLNYQWYRSSGTGDSGFSQLGGATTDPYNDTTAPAPTITAGAASASDGTSASFVTLSLSGSSANVGSQRYYYATLSATGATNQDTNHNSGYIGIGSLTYQWQRSASTTDDTYSDIPSATTDPYNDTGAPSDGSKRYYKCTLNAAGATQQVSSSNDGYRAYISITISDSGVISYGNMSVGDTKSTLQLSPVKTKSLQNTGNITEKFNIKTSKAVGGTEWSIGTTPGTNIFVHEFSSNGGSSWTLFDDSTNYKTLSSSVNVNGTVNLDLRITTPSSSDAVEKTITVTVQATTP